MEQNELQLINPIELVAQEMDADIYLISVIFSERP